MRTLLLRLPLLLALTFATTATAGQQPADPAAAAIVRSWNAAVETLEPEGQNFRELLASYRRNPPGRVLLTAEVRAEQRKHRLRLINEIINSHQERLQKLRDLAKFEEASQ